MANFIIKIINFFKKLFEIIHFFIISFFKELIPDTFNSNSNSNNEALRTIIKGQILYLKSDSIFRESPNSSSKIFAVLNKGTKLTYLGKTIHTINGETFDEVSIIKEEIISPEIIGYILREQLSNKKILETKDSLPIEYKAKIIKEILKILKLNTSYSNDKLKRTYGYLSKKYDDTYYFDSSSFISYILNKVFEFNNEKIWDSNDYLKEIKKKNSKFEIIQNITTPKDTIDNSKLEIGDIILGVATNVSNGINHMMMYIGEGYIIHCTNDRLYGIQSNKLRNGVVKEKLNDTKYYTELESIYNLVNGIITRRFDISITVLRYKNTN